jgi:hypothetical protein
MSKQNKPAGKKSIVNTLNESPDAGKKKFQEIMHKANNCIASFWTCKNCPVPKLHKCVEKTRQHLQMEAFKKYKDDPRYREMIYKNNGVSL